MRVKQKFRRMHDAGSLAAVKGVDEAVERTGSTVVDQAG
jgi:hypothetical protein